MAVGSAGHDSDAKTIFEYRRGGGWKKLLLASVAAFVLVASGAQAACL
jgi:hypothetical protein